MAADPVRDAAIDVLLRVFEQGRFLDDSLGKTLRRKQPADRSRRFLTQLVYGTVRHRLLCDHILNSLCHQPLDKLPASILIIMRMGIFQSLFLQQVTHPAMVHTSVDLAKKRGHAGTARLVNAVLRKAPTSLEQVRLPDPAQDLKEHLRLRYSMPRWLVTRWINTYGPEAAEAACRFFSGEAPLTFRTNTLRLETVELQQRLQRSGIETVKATRVPEELTFLSGSSPFRSKLFLEGLFTIQDPASMLAAHLLEPQPGDRVLDMCAAPGGKSTHIAQLSGEQASVVAMDAQPRRLYSVQENIDRLGLSNVQIVCGDANQPPLRGQFRRVLLDAPCSSLGTLRRHPDLKWRLQPDAIPRLAEEQKALLRRGIELCENGGCVVYSVCTLTPEETTDVVDAVLGDKTVVPEDGPEWLECWKKAPGQYQTTPWKEALDGFFLTRLRKVS